MKTVDVIQACSLCSPRNLWWWWSIGLGGLMCGENITTCSTLKVRKHFPVNVFARLSASLCIPFIPLHTSQLHNGLRVSACVFGPSECWVQAPFKDISTDRGGALLPYLTTHSLSCSSAYFYCSHMVYRHAGCCVRDPGERCLHESVHVPWGDQLRLHEWSHGLWRLQASGHQLWSVQRAEDVSYLWSMWFHSACFFFIFPNVFTADYDAPLSEAGDYTPKYQLLRNLFSQYHCNVFF